MGVDLSRTVLVPDPGAEPVAVVDALAGRSPWCSSGRSAGSAGPRSSG